MLTVLTAGIGDMGRDGGIPSSAAAAAAAAAAATLTAADAVANTRLVARA